MSSVFYQIPIRAELDIISAPPVVPIDNNTGAQVKLWRAQDVSMQVGIFQPNNQSIDLSNLVSLSLIIQETPTSVSQVLNKVVVAADIFPTISRASWLDGTGQQASFILTAAETDVGLDGNDSKQFWMIIRGVTDTGQTLNYGGGYIRIYNPGNLTSTIMAGIVSLHSQTNTTGNSIVTPTSLIHTEVISVGGTAPSTRNILVSPDGLIAGAQVWLNLAFLDKTVTPITIKIYTASLGGELLLTYVTDGFQPNALLFLSADGNGGFDQAMLVSPSFNPGP